MIAAVRKDVHVRCLNFRALDRLVHSEAFEQALKKDPDNIWVQFSLLNGNVEWIEAWIDKVLAKELGEMSLRELRAEASRLGIANYTAFSKDLLLMKVNNARRAKEAASRMPDQQVGSFSQDSDAGRVQVPDPSCS